MSWTRWTSSRADDWYELTHETTGIQVSLSVAEAGECTASFRVGPVLPAARLRLAGPQRGPEPCPARPPRPAVPSRRVDGHRHVASRFSALPSTEYSARTTLRL